MNKLIVLAIVALAFTALCDANGSRRKNRRRNGGLGQGANLIGARGGQNLNRVLGARGRGGAGSDTAAEIGAFQGSSLKASDKAAEAADALLQAKEAHQAKLDKKAARKQRRAERQKARDSQALKAGVALNLEQTEVAEEFDTLQAAANLDKENNFDLRIASSNRHSEQAAIKEESGAKAAAGQKLSFREEIDAHTSQEAEAAFSNDFLDENSLNAAEAIESLFNAQESARQQQEADIDAQEVQQFGKNFRNNDLAFNNIFGGFDPFFKRK